MQLPESWRGILGEETAKPYFRDLEAYVAAEREAGPVFPPDDEVFAALALTPYDQVRVLLLGQDPYHGLGQAHGLAFSVKPGIGTPPSLRNIYKELAEDCDCPIPSHGNLTAWATQGVLLLNTVLTVRQAQANSHKRQGWETFTDAVIRAVNEKSDRVVFLLWGSPAKKKTRLITNPDHAVVASAHPSPLSARNGFFGSRPFSQVNDALVEAGRPAIDWCLPEG